MEGNSLQKIHEHLAQNQLTEALELCEQALANDENNSEILHLAAITAAHLNQLDRALHFIQRALTTDRENPQVLNSYGNILLRHHKVDEAIEAFEAAGRTELAQREKEELAIIKSYLPEQLSAAQVREAVERIVSENGFGKADFGKAMGAVMAELNGQAEGTLVAGVLKELLAA